MIKQGIEPNEISPFTNNIIKVALVIFVCGIILAAPLGFISHFKNIKALNFLSFAIEFLVWAYLTCVLCLFFKETRLIEYIIQHLYIWLLGVVVIPLNYLVYFIITFFEKSNKITFPYFFIIVFIAMVAILVVRRYRFVDYETEIAKNTQLWQNLFKKKPSDIFLFRYENQGK